MNDYSKNSKVQSVSGHNDAESIKLNVSGSKKAGFLTRMVILLMLIPVLSINVQAQENVITFDIGSFAVTLLSEGQQSGNKGILIGATDEMLEKTIPDGTFPMAINTFLVETGDKTILFDAGLGTKLFDNLKAYGKTPADIDAIVITHMHGDHIGGLLQNDVKSFPSAELYIPQTEYDYWINDEKFKSMPENEQRSFIGPRKVVEAYKDKLHLFMPGEIDKVQELFPGIRSIAAYGHTPGHTGYMLESGKSGIFIWGDITHAMAIQIPFPEVAVTYDVDPVKAVESRQLLMKYVSENKIKIAGMHIPFPGIGTIKKDDSGRYEFELICNCEGR